MRIAVVAHRGKTLGDGLPELRKRLTAAGIDDDLWFEVPKSKQAPKRVRQAVKAGAERVLVWGGDGMVRRCIGELAGSDVLLGILPAGTANLLATNLGIPHDLARALDVALRGAPRPLDVGTVNGERFAVMAGAGFDGHMIRAADTSAKQRLGRLAYVVTGARATREAATRIRVRVDGKSWFSGRASCVLVGNVSTATAGLVLFDRARPDDGVLDVGIVTAQGSIEWLRVLGRAVRHHAAASPFVRVTRGAKVDVRLDRPLPYELDGGDRGSTRHLRFGVEPRAINVLVPNGAR